MPNIVAPAPRSTVEQALVVGVLVGMVGFALAAADLGYVGYLAQPWNRAGLPATFAAAWILAALGLGAVSLLRSVDTPPGVRATHGPLLDRVAEIAASVGERPPDRVQLVVEPRVELVHAGRVWSRQTTLVLGTAVVASLTDDELGAAVAEGLLRYGSRSGLLAAGRASTGLVAFALASARAGTAVSGALTALMFLALFALPAVVVGGFALPLARVQARSAAQARERATAGASAVHGAAALASAHETLASLDEAWSVLVVAAKRDAAGWSFTGGLADALAARVARARRVEGLPDASPPSIVLPESARTDASREFARRVLKASASRLLVPARAASRHPVGLADQLDAVGGGIRFAHAERAVPGDDGLTEALLARHDPAAVGRLRAFHRAEREVARLTRFWAEGPGEARIETASGRLSPYGASSAVKPATEELVASGLAIGRDVEQVVAVHRAIAARLGPDWERATTEAVGLVRFVAREKQRLEDLHVTGRRLMGAKAKWGPAVVWDELAGRLASVSAPGVPGFPRFTGPRNATFRVQLLEAEVNARLAEVVVAVDAARDHLVDVLDAVGAAWVSDRARPCPVPPILVPADPPAREGGLVHDRRAALLKRVPPLSTAIGAASALVAGPVAVGLVGLRIAAGMSHLVAYNGSSLPLTVTIGGESTRLEARGWTDAWFVVPPGAVALGASVGDRSLDEASVRLGFRPAQVVYNIGGRGVLVDAEVVWTTRLREKPREAIVLGVPRVVVTDAEYLFVEPPPTKEIKDTERSKLISDAAANVGAGDAVRVLLLDPPAESLPDSFTLAERTAAAGSLAEAALLLDPPGADTATLLDAAVRVDPDGAPAAILRAQERWHAAAESDGSAAAWIAASRLEVQGSAGQLDALDRGVRIDPGSADARCLRGSARAWAGAWTDAADDLEQCASADVGEDTTLRRVYAARVVGRSVAPILAGADPELRAVYELEPYPPDAQDAALFEARRLLSHGDLAGALARLPAPPDRDGDEQRLALLIALSDGGSGPNPQLVVPGLGIWGEVAARDVAGGPLEGVDPCDAAAVEEAARGRSPESQGVLWAAAAVLAGPCRPPVVADRARQLSIPGEIPYFR